jgi:hypothetical protein
VIPLARAQWWRYVAQPLRLTSVVSVGVTRVKRRALRFAQ